MQVGFAPGAAQSTSATGGRRRLADDSRPLFGRTVDSLKNPGVNGQPEQGGQPEGRRRLQQDEEPQLFSRTHHSLKTAHHRWNNRTNDS